MNREELVDVVAQVTEQDLHSIKERAAPLQMGTITESHSHLKRRRFHHVGL